MASRAKSADACSSSSDPSTASSSSFKKASRRLTRNGMSLKRISVSSLTEARAATASALRAGKYRVKETSRDLWSRTKAPLAEGKRKSKELVDRSSDLISNLSIRVQKKLHHGRHQRPQSFCKSPHLDRSESDQEYFWESDFSDSSISDSSGDEEADGEENGIMNGTSNPGETRNGCDDGRGNVRDNEVEVTGEVAGARTRSKQAVECKSIRKIHEEDQYRPAVSLVPSIEQIRAQLQKIQKKSTRRQQDQKGSDANQVPDQFQPNHYIKASPDVVHPPSEQHQSCDQDASELQPKKTRNASLISDSSVKTYCKMVPRPQRPREQPPPPPPPPPLPRTLPPSLLSSTSSLNSAPLSLSSTPSPETSQSPTSWKVEEDVARKRSDRKLDEVEKSIKCAEFSDGSNRHDGCERRFYDSKHVRDGLQTIAVASAVVREEEDDDDDDDEERDEDDDDTDSSYEVPVDSCPWFRPDLTRSEAEKYLLSLDSHCEGCFVIRPGGSVLYPYSLSLVNEGKVCHLNIRTVPGSESSYSLGKGTSGRVFSNLKHLVMYYANKPLMLVSSKSQPVPNHNNNHDLPTEPRKYVRLSLIG